MKASLLELQDAADTYGVCVEALLDDSVLHLKMDGKLIGILEWQEGLSVSGFCYWLGMACTAHWMESSKP